MQTTASALEKKAIKFALNEDWENAISTNLELLELEPTDMKAKMRLGRAYLLIKDFANAEQLFKDVLEFDSINSIAKKNYELAKSKKVEANSQAIKSAFIKEPGITTETPAEITEKGITANSFSHGENLGIIVSNSTVFITKEGKKIGVLIDEKIIKRVHYANKLEANLKALFVKGEGKNITLLLKSSEPVFKGDKQDVKPYLKKGSIEEPELEIESFDDE